VNSAKDFQLVTLVSDSLMAKISPYFKFPEWVENRNSKKSNNILSSNKALNIMKQDLNLAAEADLIKVKGVGEVLAARIIKYRTKLGGFISEIQLKDIYGLNFEAKQEILLSFKVISKPEINRLDINKATVLELASVPYIDYELAREIMNYKLLHEEIVTFEELAKIKDFPSEEIDRIALYLTLE
jgi:DNA uptake protein ComE-like DNA-binding protein